MGVLRSNQRWLAAREWRRRVVFWGGAILTGAIAVAFAICSEWAMQLFSRACELWPWWPFVGAPLGLALAVWSTRRWFPGAEGSGIPQTIAALSLPTEGERNKVLSLGCLRLILVTLVALSSGASIGREGPTVQVGARSCTRCAATHAFRHWKSTGVCPDCGSQELLRPATRRYPAL